jgi:hypothetical protein
MSARPRVCFLYIAQKHQVLHSLSIAHALALGWPEIEVEVAATTPAHIAYVRELNAMLGSPELPAKLLGPAWLRRSHPNPPKALMLAMNAARLGRYDAIVVPERTSSMLRKFGLTRQKLIYTQHGAGDRGGPFEPRLRLFDLVNAAGPAQRDRLVGEGWVAAENCAMVGYPKFEMVDAMAAAGIASPAPVFADTKPVVFFNPHFHDKLGAWSAWGAGILAQFASDTRYNLIFAPHIRLFSGADPASIPALAPYLNHPRIHIDLGGPAAIDMTYSRCADVYLGDVSSQIYEFLRKPRPCVFLNPSQAAWAGDESFRHWRYGPVLAWPDGLIDALDAARAGHGAYLPVQAAGFAQTFDLQATPSSQRAAAAIVQRLGR